MAHLFRVILPVGDIEHAAKFYSAVLGSDGRRVSPGRHYCDCEGTIFACYDPEADGDGYAARPNPEPLYLAVTDLEAPVGRGVVLHERPVRQPRLLRVPGKRLQRLICCLGKRRCSRK
jgi:predicted enzyme related to lactoylglutathione lyase